MPIFDRITFSVHALERMQERGISQDDVRFALDHGEAAVEEDGIWYVELGTLCVAFAERDNDTGHVVTVFHRRKHT